MKTKTFPFLRRSASVLRPLTSALCLLSSALCLLSSALCLLTLCPQASAQSTAFTYQGQLDHLGGPANGQFDLAFSLWTGPVGPSQVGVAVTNVSVMASNGLVSVTVDFGAAPFTGADRWLEIAMRTNGNGPFTTLVPRQQLTPTPYAITAANLTGGGLSGLYSNAVTLNNPANSFFGAFTGNGANATNLNAANLAAGTVLDARLSANVALLNNTQTFSGAKSFTNAGNSFTGNGAGLTALNASSLASGTVADARLGANVALLNTAQTFVADKTFGTGAQILADTGSASAPGLSFNGDPNTGIFSPTAEILAVTTLGAERMRINSTGDLGLGTTAPEARLHVMEGTAGTVTANGNSIAVLERSANAYLSLLTPIANESGILFGTPTNSADGGFVFNNVSTVRGLQIRTGGNFTKMVVLADGRVGIGTISPGDTLDVRGDVKLGPSGQFFAPGGEENLRLLRGHVSTVGTVTDGSGFSSTNSSTGVYRVTFNTGFASTPTVVATAVDTSSPQIATVGAVTTTFFDLRIWNTASALINSDFHFIVTGPR